MIKYIAQPLSVANGCADKDKDHLLNALLVNLYMYILDTLERSKCNNTLCSVRVSREGKRSPHIGHM